MRSNFVSVWSHISTQKYPLKNRICSLVFRVHLSCDFRLLFLIKFGEILIFLAENLAHGSQKNLAQNVNTFAFLSCQIFVVDHSKTVLFFAFKTCCEILLCNSIAIIHYFWKTKVLNLKNFASTFLTDFLAWYTVEKLEFRVLFSYPLLGNPINTC
jgi:hypothetical protein